MPYGKLKVDTLTYDNSGSDVDIAISSIPSSSTLAAKANLASPTFTGIPAAPTAAADTNTTQIATTAYVVGQGYLKSATASSTYLATGAIGTTVQAYDANTAKTNVAQAFSAPQRGSLTTLSISSGAVTIDLNNTNNYYLDLNANVSSITFSNATAGQMGSIFIKQSGTFTMGGWPAAAKFSGGTAPTITATNGKYDRIDYAIYDASNVHLVWTGNY